MGLCVEDLKGMYYYYPVLTSTVKPNCLFIFYCIEFSYYSY